MTINPVEYRKPSAPPTEPGWYYGRSSYADALSENRVIRPWKVAKVDPDTNIFIEFNSGAIACVTGLLDWFGPVMEVREG